VLDVEKQARTVDIEAAFTNEDEIKDLLAGYSADVEIVLATRAETLIIPTEAIIDGDKVFVYTPGEQVVHEVQIEVGLANWATAEVLSGLEEGDLVVTTIDKPGLKDGVKATLAEALP
jgi:HlyD family secretion protein